MLIHVTSEHIQNGQRNDCTGCPIALALLEKYYDARVAADFMQIKKQPYDDWRYLQFPKAVKTFIQKFDSGEEVFPFSFTTKAKEEV